MIPLRAAAAAAVLPMAAAACATFASPLIAPATPITPVAAAAALEAAGAGVRTLRGLADVILERGGRQERFREAAILALPDKLRLETLQFGGATALVVATNGDHLAIYSLATNEFAQGHASAGALATLTGVAMEPRHLLRLLAGLPPLAFQAADPRSRVEAEGEAFVAESAEGVFWQRLRLDAGGNLSGGELRTAAGPVFTFQFDDLRRLPGRSFPYRLLFEQPGGARVEMAYRSVEVNPPLDAAVFTLSVPAGDVRVLDLDAARPR